eukprot:Phypoly_transcript_15940.p1 GENE.Phypoly_transcript_15940~~Phypoly_transcript_15940.p1  ORF type:complete len:199 (+),score=41.83 Phypoly_transcript_15940:3-599(+)
MGVQKEEDEKRAHNNPKERNEHADLHSPPHEEDLEDDFYAHAVHPIEDKLLRIAEHVISSTTSTPLPTLQCELFRGETRVCNLQGVYDDVFRPDPDYFTLPPILHVTQRTPLSYLLTTNIMGEWSGGGKGGHSLVYLWPKDSIVDRPAFNSFLLYLFEKNCAGVVEIDHASKMYLMPPCDATYQMYGSKSKGSLMVLK